MQIYIQKEREDRQDRYRTTYTNTSIDANRPRGTKREKERQDKNGTHIQGYTDIQ